MESFVENQNTGLEKTKLEQILATARIIEILKHDNDFEELVSLNFLSKQLEGLQEEQFNLCIEFIKREYNKFTISKQQRPGLYNELFYTRTFINHSILDKFKEEKLSLVLQFLLKYENIDLCTEYFYKHEKRAAESLERMSKIQISSVLSLSQESVKNLTNIMKSRPEITAFLIENIDIFTNKQITHLQEIDKICNNYSSKNSNVCIDIFGLLYLKHPIDIKQNIKNIFTSVAPQFTYNTYDGDNTDCERVDIPYYQEQLERMQNEFLKGNLTPENFLKYLRGNDLNKEVFQEGCGWRGR